MIPSRDVGLGTAYERWAIYRRLVGWLGRAPPRTAIEGPVDGMAGLPGLHLLPLARRGTRVTVVHADAAARERVRAVYRRAGLEASLELRDALPPRTHELGLLFNHGPHVPDWRATLAALAERVDGTLIVFATHPGSYGVALRRMVRRLEPVRAPEQFEHEASDPRALREALRRHGRIVDEAFVDCPWWPDLFVEAGQTLVGATRARLGGRPTEAPRGTAWDAGPDDLPFALSDAPTPLRRALRRHPHFDGWPEAVARWFAHHRAFRVERHRMDLVDGAEYP